MLLILPPVDMTLVFLIKLKWPLRNINAQSVQKYWKNVTQLSDLNVPKGMSYLLQSKFQLVNEFLLLFL